MSELLKNLIIAEMANALNATVGKNAHAILRRTGISISQILWPELPSGLKAEDAGKILVEKLNENAYFGECRMGGIENGEIKVEFKNCFLSDITDLTGSPCGEQLICQLSFGIIEETFHRLSGEKVRVKFERFDQGKNTCYKTIFPR